MGDIAVSPSMEFPTRERVLAGESFYYDEEGEGRALCCRCFCTIDLEFEG